MSASPGNPKLAELHRKMASRNLRGYWQLREGGHTPTPDPWLWPWSEIEECVMESGELVTVGAGGDTFRRTIALVNPTAPGNAVTSKTIMMSVQLVMPGEAALAHRHTATALRFVVQGSREAYTTSDGEQMFMETNDLLIQPNWTWHDHANAASTPVIWLDGLDGGVTGFLDANFREDYPGEGQPVTRPDGHSRRSYGTLRLKDGDTKSPSFKYRGEETLDTLRALAAVEEGDPYEGVILEYANPVVGGPTFRTMACSIQLLRPGEITRMHRHTGTTIYHSVQGKGVTTVDKEDTKELRWGNRDCFVLPPWRWHRHANASSTEPAILFSMTDRPLLQAAGLHREEGE